MRSFQSLLRAGERNPTLLRSSLLDFTPSARDMIVDRAMDLGLPPDDGPELPNGCVPYLPCSVDAILRAIELASIGRDDVLVDLGSGMGRAAVLMHLLCGARCVGIEVQPKLVAASRALAARLSLAGVAFVEGDVAGNEHALADGTVFFLYCPFSGQRLAQVLEMLERIARTREIRICTVDLPLPCCDWLDRIAPQPTSDERGEHDLAVYRSNQGRGPT